MGTESTSSHPSDDDTFRANWVWYLSQASIRQSWWHWGHSFRYTQLPTLFSINDESKSGEASDR